MADANCFTMDKARSVPKLHPGTLEAFSCTLLAETDGAHQGVSALHHISKTPQHWDKVKREKQTSVGAPSWLCLKCSLRCAEDQAWLCAPTLRVTMGLRCPLKSFTQDHNRRTQGISTPSALSCSLIHFLWEAHSSISLPSLLCLQQHLAHTDQKVSQEALLQRRTRNFISQERKQRPARKVWVGLLFPEV